ncbi:MAG: RNA 3'-terminal phosphate cyclase [Nanoarchaeota archaeon]
MISLDGSHGEGGGSMLRYALALATLTQKPFRMYAIRKGRDKPGLKPQHLFCIRGLEDLCGAVSEGAEIGSLDVTFYPRPVSKDSISIAIGTAGSVTLLLQAFMLPLLFQKRTIVKVTGGTDVPFSQPYDYFTQVFLSALAPYGDIECSLERRGFYPKGDGKLSLVVKGRYNYPEPGLPVFNYFERGDVQSLAGVSYATSLLEKADVALRMKKAARHILPDVKIREEYAPSASDGAGIVLWATYEKTVLGASALGKRGVRAEDVGRQAGEDMKREMDSSAVVDRHLADQLIPYMGAVTRASGKECVIKTSEITDHLRSNVYVTEAFLDVSFQIDGNQVTCTKTI